MPVKKEDLIGRVFGMLTVIGEAPKSGSSYYSLCRCECGVIKGIAKKSLKSGFSKSCGCARTLSRIKDLTGKVFGRLTALRIDPSYTKGAMRWICSCSCGEVRSVSRGSSLSGRTTSCGCYMRQVVKALRATHGLSKTDLYFVHYEMRARCGRDTHHDYKNYGGRGIKVCQEWLNSIDEFYKWSVSTGYRKGLTLDRINVDGHYEPNNCRWVTQQVQCRENNRRLKPVIQDGKILYSRISLASKLSGANRSSIGDAVKGKIETAGRSAWRLATTADFSDPNIIKVGFRDNLSNTFT
jgi:hypothetical protein